VDCCSRCGVRWWCSADHLGFAASCLDGVGRHRRPSGAVLQLAVMGSGRSSRYGYSGAGRRNTGSRSRTDRDGRVHVATCWAQPLLDIRAGASVLTRLAAGPVSHWRSPRPRRGLLGGRRSACVAVLRGVTTRRRILGNVQLLLVAGLVLGYAVFDMRQAGARPRAIATESATASGCDSVVSIHDGRMQVLAQFSAAVRRSRRGGRTGNWLLSREVAYAP